MSGTRDDKQSGAQEQRPSLVSQEERKQFGKEGENNDDKGPRVIVKKFNQRLNSKVLVQSHDSIWQDTIDDSIENIVNELTHTLNYSSGYADDRLKDITDALCGKSLREKL